MILSRTKIIRLYHFIRPILSSLNSLKDLENVLQKRLVEDIKQVNDSKLKHYSFADEIAQQLKLTPLKAKQIRDRTIQLSIINARTQKHQTRQVRVNQDLKRIKFQSSDFGFPFPQPHHTMHHFSQFRGVPTFSELNQYEINSQKLFIFNLPDNITRQDLQVILKTQQAKIKFQYCILGLVAYAELQFPSYQSLQKCLEMFPQNTLQFGDRTAKIRTLQDKVKLKLGCRRLVVNIDQNRKLSQMVIEFSKYGRVLNIQWPVEVWMNPTIGETRQHYQNSSELVKINQIFSDGTVESEYCPALKAWQNWQDEREQQNLIDKAEKMQESYEQRARFAKNINIYPGRQHEIMTGNKGYCVVTYSTFQQCQNYYFATGSRDKIQLVGDKLDFEYDPTFRRQLLRHVDNQFLTGKKKQLALQKKHEDKYSRLVQMTQKQKVTPNKQFSYKIAQTLLKKLTYKQSMTRRSRYKIFRKKNYRANTLYEWKLYLNKMKNQKAQTNRKSFDELAEMELYGRVLPKDVNKERLIIQDTTYTPHPYVAVIKQNRLITTMRDLYRRKKFYRRQIERNNRLADQAAGKVHPEKPANNRHYKGKRYPRSHQKVNRVKQSVRQSEAGQIGKQHFSTGKPLSLYRKRTPKEQAHFNRRFFQFMRNTIFEYMGIFQDKIIEEVADHKTQILNPQSLKWPDGTSFLTEQQLTHILQFRRNLEKAQQDFTNYIFGSEYLKSSGRNLNNIFGNFNELQNSALQYITDVGIVQQVKKVGGQNLQQKVKILNAQIANFGEEYRISEDKNNNTNYLIKIRKLEHLLPIDRVAHLQNFITEHGENISKDQSQIFSKHYKEMKQKDSIPDQVSDAFGVERGKKFSDLLAEVGAVYQISKKDLEMVERAKIYSSEELKKDLDNQLKLERSRKNLRKTTSNSFAKDPSEIYVKDRQGYFKVSRFRQI